MTDHIAPSHIRKIAYFVSPHGFGHASRSAAVMEALRDRLGSVQFEIFTRIPRWFFEDSHLQPFGYHDCLTDIGVVQKSPLHEDLEATIERLAAFLPFDTAQVADLAETVRASGCELVICDIAPLGLAVARKAGLPSILIENFTWDWIYEGYSGLDARMGRAIDILRSAFQLADAHVQTEPVCAYKLVDLIAPPASRRPRTPRDVLRSQLNIPLDAPMVLITMGGIPESYAALGMLEQQSGVYFVLPGSAAQRETRGNLILLPHHSPFYHPDLIGASDGVIGKVGYSTIAEVYQADVPFGYVTRPHFRESAPLAAYIQRELQGFEIAEADFTSGAWVERLPDLLALPRGARQRQNGADVMAAFITAKLAAPGVQAQ